MGHPRANLSQKLGFASGPFQKRAACRRILQIDRVGVGHVVVPRGRVANTKEPGCASNGEPGKADTVRTALRGGENVPVDRKRVPDNHTTTGSFGKDRPGISSLSAIGKTSPLGPGVLSKRTATNHSVREVTAPGPLQSVHSGSFVLQ